MFDGATRQWRMGTLVLALAGAPFILGSQPGVALAASGPRCGRSSVAARLGGYPGILTFLQSKALPALLADPDIAPFFTHLSETPDDIAQCLAFLLDQELGGSSPQSGEVLADAHSCRSSQAAVHAGLNIPDAIIDKFVMIVGEQATAAGVAPKDIRKVAKALNRFRSDIRNK